MSEKTATGALMECHEDESERVQEAVVLNNAFNPLGTMHFSREEMVNRYLNDNRFTAMVRMIVAQQRTLHYTARDMLMVLEAARELVEEQEKRRLRHERIDYANHIETA